MSVAMCACVYPCDENTHFLICFQCVCECVCVCVSVCVCEGVKRFMRVCMYVRGREREREEKHDLHLAKLIV